MKGSALPRVTFTIIVVIIQGIMTMNDAVKQPKCDLTEIVIIIISPKAQWRRLFVDTGAEWSKSHIMIFIGAIILGIIVHFGF